MRIFLSLAALSLSSPLLGNNLTSAEIDKEAARVMESFRPAGMALAVVQDGEVIFAKGYGLQRQGSPGQVDANTVFNLASVSKSFTATALGILVDEGKLDWDTPVRQYLPDFKMSDPVATAHLTVRDLLVHRSGLALGAGDLLRWPDGNATDAEVINSLQYLPFATGFRDQFVYDNILYMVAGELITRVSGQIWQQFYADRLFVPLGLSSCTADPDNARLANRAIEHARAPGVATGKPIDDMIIRPDPSGSIACSVTDVAQWAVFHLGNGTSKGGKTIVRPETMQTLHRGVVPVGAFGAPRRLGYTNVSQYALGWFVSDFAGTLLLDHSGSGPGAATHVGILPDNRAAVIVLANDLVPAPAVANHLLARVVQGRAAKDWIADVIARRAARRAAPTADQVPTFTETAPRRPLSHYVGTYRDPWYGEITVEMKVDGLVIHLTRSKILKGPLVPLGSDRFLARWPNRDIGADAIVSFVEGKNGRIDSMKLAPAHESVDFSYNYQHLAPVRQ